MYQCSNVLYRHKTYACIAISRSQSLGCSQQLSCSGIIETSEGTTNTMFIYVICEQKTIFFTMAKFDVGKF